MAGELVRGAAKLWFANLVIGDVLRQPERGDELLYVGGRLLARTRRLGDERHPFPPGSRRVAHYRGDEQGGRQAMRDPVPCTDLLSHGMAEAARRPSRP